MTLNAIAIPHQTPGSAAGLLILLHGWGANRHDLAGLAPYLKRPEIDMVFPDAPFPHPQVPGGCMWYGLSSEFTATGANLGMGDQFEAEVKQSRALLLDWIQGLTEQTGIPLSQTILGGFSQGGAMTLDLSYRLPVAGLMVLSGFLHGDLPQSPDDLTFPLPPMLLAHGRQDPVVPLVLAHEARDALTHLKAPLQYHELEMGHEISLELLNLMQTFIGEVVS